MHRAALEVSGDVSPIHRFLGTDGVCGGGAVGRRNNQGGESIALPSPRRHVVQWRCVLTSASVMMDDEQGGFENREQALEIVKGHARSLWSDGVSAGVEDKVCVSVTMIPIKRITSCSAVSAETRMV
jgi:hypothetical protein